MGWHPWYTIRHIFFMFVGVDWFFPMFLTFSLLVPALHFVRLSVPRSRVSVCEPLDALPCITCPFLFMPFLLLLLLSLSPGALDVHLCGMQYGSGWM